ncbi:MAG: type I DNA topoisomerase [Bdellovibrionales bacterium]|nr:type I DNA topoisomerase [Bdellovibrionales bacterium]
MKLVIVESPTKARTIKKFLGPEYHVESCMGHVRDLPQSAKDIPEKYKKEEWSRLGVNVEKDFEPIYCIPKAKTKVVRELKNLLKDADELILATDEDREGESISWHLVEVLKPRVPTKRMVFHEITKKAIEKAIKEFRDVDMDLVRAQEARRILDRLVGYTLSPLLWKKVAYGLSAGRVQSVAVGLIADRELERLKFKKANYWGVYAKNNMAKTHFESRLWSYKGKRVATGRDFDPDTGKLAAGKDGDTLWLDQKAAAEIQKAVAGATWTVDTVEEKPVTRKPAPPFITSTLQQEANRKLNLSAKETMQVAQKLYEQGYITYMRTDSKALSTQAIDAARDRIKSLYGKEYVPEAPRGYEDKKVKGAQEAHEAIRPAGTEMTPPEDTKLKGVARSLYELIWKRTIASQMPNAQLKQVNVRLTIGEAIFSASGQSVEFPGFLKVYVESTDEESDGNQKEILLPKMKKGDSVECKSAESKEHETKPPARYTEASLVQMMEKEGIGRPSTYAAILSTIVDRGYVSKVGNALVPSFTALIVSRLLKKYLPTYVDLGFTSQMENSLDEVAAGNLDSNSYLKGVYWGDKGLQAQVDKQESAIDPEQARQIEFPELPDLSFRVGRYGAYVCRTDLEEELCASLPDSQAPADISVADCHKLIEQKLKGADSLGADPETGEPIYVLNGRYGPYVQLGDASNENTKPKRTTLPAGLEPEDVTFDQALYLLSLPKTLGDHPGLNKEVKVGIGRFGPFVVCDGDFRSIPKTKSLFEVDFEYAMELLSQPKRSRGKAAALKELGKHPETEEDMNVFNGRYGPYIKMGKINVSLPDDLDIDSCTAAKAIELLSEKLEKVKRKTTTKKKTKKKASKKAKVAKKASKVKKTGGKAGASASQSKTVIRRSATATDNG